MTKIGQKSDPTQRRHRLAPVAESHKEDIRKYNKVRAQLFALAGGKSELDGTPENDREIGGALEPHHIGGRIGPKLYNPFNIIIVTGKQHWIAQETMSWENKQALLAYIRPRRIEQGFKVEDYE